MDYGAADTELRLADIAGDSTGTIHITDQQIVRAAVVEGVIGSFTTTVNFEVDEEATLHVPETLTVAGVTLDIKGTCTFKNLIVEDGGTLKGHETTYTSSYGNGVYSRTSDPGSYSLSSIKLKAGANFILPSGGLKMTIGTLEMKRFVVLEADFVQLVAANLILEREAALSTDGRANISDPLVPSEAHGRGKNGGAHTAAGGVGGNYTVDDASAPYGTIYTPLTPGASGGNGGQGGGYIQITTDELVLDGILRSSGADSTTGGGGAGGSIYVICSFALKGLGSMETVGGSTTDPDAGAGSGGHIAVDMVSDEYQGTYSAGGGTSPASHGNGGPGSIYLTSGTNGEKLIVDNENGQTDYYTTLNETALILNFDVVDIYNYAKLQLIKDGQQRELNIMKVNGDSTGLVRIQTNQKGTLERSVTNTQANSKLKINIELHDGGEFIMSETVTILGLGAVALDLDGILRGVSNLYLGPSRRMRMGSNAKIVPFSQTNTANVTYVTFGTLQLEPGSIIEYDAETGAKIQASNINLKFAASLFADSFQITCSNLDLELESSLSCSSGNRPDSDSIDVTAGSGLPGNGFNGGAAHGGVGGGGNDNNGTYVPGTSYNSLYTPTLAGSRGTYDSATGQKTGGRGGGFIRIQIGNILINDGTISADGEDADPHGADGGAGSGGSVYITVYEFEGYGFISSIGGTGSHHNGGGAAGRVAIHCSLEIEFEGSYVVFGGAGSDDTQSAGGGTVYLKDVRSGKEYQRLLLDNQNRPHDKYATIDESFTDHYFDEVHLMNQASLHMADDGRNTVLEIYKVYGDGTGLIHLHASQTLQVEYRPSVRNAFLTGVNFIIDADSEVYFPSIVYVYGKGVFLEGQTESRSVAIFGRLTGISDLILGFETLLYFGDDAHTAAIDPTTLGYGTIDPAGTVTFGTVDLRSFSEIKYSPDQDVLQKIARIDARFQSVISAESLTIQTGIFNLEAGARLTASALYRPHDTLDEALGMGIDAVITTGPLTTATTTTQAPTTTAVPSTTSNSSVATNTSSSTNGSSSLNSTSAIPFFTTTTAAAGSTLPPGPRFYGTGGGYATDGGGKSAF